MNLEVGHIYANQELSVDQIIGAEIGKEIIEHLKKHGFDVTTNVWIDDYNSPCDDGHSFAKEFLENLYEATTFLPDHYAFESESIDGCNKLLESIPDASKKWKNKGYNKKKLYVKSANGKISVIYKYLSEEKYICPALSAAYALAKCGALDVPYYPGGHQTEKPFVGELSITVLPNHPFFLESEQKAKDVISMSPEFSPYIENIFHVWFDPKHMLSSCEIEKILDDMGFANGGDHSG